MPSSKLCGLLLLVHLYTKLTSLQSWQVSVKRILAITIGILFLSGCCSVNKEEYSDLPYYSDGQFRNKKSMADTSFLEASWAMLFDKDPQSIPNGEIPIKAITKKGLEYAISHDDLILYRLGHSTILMGLEGRFWLFDPIFSERASPFQWIGPKRFHPTPIDIENLPPLAGVIISHNHYDHLDEESIKALADKTDRFYIPLGNKEFLKDWGVGVDKIYEMGWWDSLKDQDTTIIGTPTQHFSGRSLSDRNETLWMSWVLQTDQ